MLKFTPRRHLIGGVRLPPHKEASTAKPVLRGLIPPRLFVSTRQHRGPASRPTVEIGQAVARGDLVAKAVSAEGTDVHAPTSGRVVGIRHGPVPLGSLVTTEELIVIETDGRDLRATGMGPVEPGETPEALIAQIAAAGIVGLGGAIYPTAAKLRSGQAAGCKLLIINGAECEPYISCDDMLMREGAEAIIDGACRLRDLVGAPECIIAIERDKPQAIEAITAAAESLGAAGLRVAELPSIYPAGGERQLVEVLTGAEIPSSGFPGNEGYLCQNVGTAFAVHNYFSNGEPLTSRIVTVTGSAVAEPRNVEAMIGTPISDLIAACGGYRSEVVRLIHGGSMMGFALESDALPITKSSNCIIAATSDEVRSDTREWPCIRCGECAIACPSRLLPQDLLLAARAGDAAELDALALEECIECGCCDFVCPSHIPLTETFRRAKPLLRTRGQQRKLSEAADERYRSREERRQEARRAEDSRREEIKLTLQHEAGRERAIRAAVERARQRKPATRTDDH